MYVRNAKQEILINNDSLKKITSHLRDITKLFWYLLTCVHFFHLTILDISRPCQSVGSHRLPTSTDVVSSVLTFFRKVGSHEGLTSLSGVWSELVLQDIAATVHSAGAENQCCSGERNRHPECYEMRVEKLECKRYWRSVPSLSVYDCQFETREQMNGVSAYLDGSGIYGATDDKLHLLRTYEDGKVDLSACELCNRSDQEALGMLHRVLLSEHNRVAEKLAAANVHWDDTKLFLETRRIVVAQLQHITFNEYMPAILREAALVDPELRPLSNGFYTGYSSSNRVGTYHAVALAALRALAWMRADKNHDIEDHLTASANLVGLAAAPDAAAWSVHVARDHGVPGYVKFLAECLGENVKVNFEKYYFALYTFFLIKFQFVIILSC